MEIGSDITKHYGFLSEYGMMRNHHVDGIFVIPSHGNVGVWWGIFFVRSGYYEDGAFFFSMHLGDDYPALECPRIFFKSKVYHPLVNADTGEVDVRRGFPVWKENINHFWQVLHLLRRMFVKVEADEPVNAEAAAMFLGNSEEFRARCQECVGASRRNLYAVSEPDASDRHEIRFDVINDDEFFDDVRQLIMKDSKCLSFQSQCSAAKGYSWIDRDSLMVFSDDSF